MAISRFYLGYKKLSKAVFEWQAADRTSLLAFFMVMDVCLHWLWCFFVWWRRDVYHTYVDIDLLYPLWGYMTLVGVFLLWMSGPLSPVRNRNGHLYRWQAVLITVYSVYIAVVVVVLGHSSLVAGISLVGGAMLGMMLIRRHYVWRAFLGQTAVILMVTLMPYFGITLPNLRQMMLSAIPVDTYSYLTYSEMTMMENAAFSSVFENGVLNWENIDRLRQSSAFFWRSTHLYMALPKATFIIYMFRTLLVILDGSRKEILQHANQDELTQLTNRRYGLMQMKQALITTERLQDFSVVLLDLDWFKKVNDSHGHDVGDRVLMAVAQTLPESLRSNTIVSRYGGEEFLIVLPDTKHDSAMVIAEKLRHDIAANVMAVDEHTMLKVTASLGLYTFTYDERTDLKQACERLSNNDRPCQRRNPVTVKRYRRERMQTQAQTKAEKALLPTDICQRLICMADKALYEAKGRGRNQVVSANEMLSTGDHKIAALYGEEMAEYS